MEAASNNFAFLTGQAPRLARLAALAERYFADDAATSLVKLRQFGEFLAKDMAARHALLSSPSASFDEVLRALRGADALPRQIADLLYYLKKLGNTAVHEDLGSTAEALQALKIARAAAIWFYKTYHGPAARNFTPGLLIPPTPPEDATVALRAEIEALRQAVRVSGDAEAQARLQVQEVEAARLAAEAMVGERERERQFWERYAAETERLVDLTRVYTTNGRSRPLGLNRPITIYNVLRSNCFVDVTMNGVSNYILAKTYRSDHRLRCNGIIDPRRQKGSFKSRYAASRGSWSHSRDFVNKRPSLGFCV